MKYITAKQALMPQGWENNVCVGIDPDGMISHVGRLQSQDARQVDLLLPAPANLHSHTFQRAMAGLTETRGPDAGDNFWTWRKLMYRFLGQLNPEHIEAIATLVFMEMLEAGFASVAEFHYLHHGQDGIPYAKLSETSERIVSAAETAGIGLTLLPVFYQYGGCDKRPLEGGQRRFGNDLEQFLRLHEGAASTVNNSLADYSIGVAPHSLRAVDPDGLNAATSLCPAGPVHLHLAEQVAEVSEFEQYFATRPTNWLLDNHDIDERWTLIHCTQMTESETDRLAQSGAVAGLCPLTEANLGDGIFNGTQYLNAGGKIGIGSDSNIHITLFEELKMLEYSQRLRDRSRAALATTRKSTGRVLFEQTLSGGAQAAKRNSGAIKPGLFADLIGIETDNQWLCNQQGDASLDKLIFTGYGQSCITDLWSAGRHVVKNGKHIKSEMIIRNFKNAIAGLGNDL